jgi:hypothetical protein
VPLFVRTAPLETHLLAAGKAVTAIAGALSKATSSCKDTLSRLNAGRGLPDGGLATTGLKFAPSFRIR